MFSRPFLSLGNTAWLLNLLPRNISSEARVPRKPHCLQPAGTRFLTTGGRHGGHRPLCVCHCRPMHSVLTVNSAVDSPDRLLSSSNVVAPSPFQPNSCLGQNVGPLGSRSPALALGVVGGAAAALHRRMPTAPRPHVKVPPLQPTRSFHFRGC